MRSLLKNFIILVNLLLIAQFSSAQLVVDFEAVGGDTKGCVPEIMNFTNLSTYNGVAITAGDANFKYSWDLGNGSMPSNFQPGTTYNSVGFFTVVLTVTHIPSGTSVTKTKARYIEMYNKPTADFTADVVKGCKGLQVCFKDNSTSSGTPIVGWNWSFGDGQTSTSKDKCITYNTVGKFNVFFKITDAVGCFSSKNEVEFVEILDINPNFNYSPSGACLPPLNVSLNATETGPYVYTWSSSNGLGASGNTANFTFNSQGNYDISLDIKGPANCQTTKTVPKAVVISNPKAGFTFPTLVCAGLNTKPINTSTGAVSYKWEYDGQTAYGNTPNIKFSNPGTYTITLTAYGPGNACSDIITKSVDVEVFAADFDISLDTICFIPQILDFTYTGDLPATKFTWFFADDKTTQNLQDVSHLYSQDELAKRLEPGTFDVILTAENPSGCVSTISKPVLYDELIPQFITDTASGCVPLLVNFTDQTSFIFPNKSITWEVFDDVTGSGNLIATGSGPNFSYNFTDDDAYLVVMTWESTVTGCTSSTQQVILTGLKPTIANDIYPFDTCAFDPNIGIDRSWVLDPKDAGQDTLIDTWNWGLGRYNGFGDFILIEPALEGKNVNIINKIDTGLFVLRRIVGYHGCYDTLYFDDYIHKKGPIVRGLLRNFNCAETLNGFKLLIDVVGGPNDTVVWLLDQNISGPSNFQPVQPSPLDPNTKFISRDSLLYDFTPGLHGIMVYADDPSTGCFYKDSINIIVNDFDPSIVVENVVPPKCPNDVGQYTYKNFASSVFNSRVAWYVSKDGGTKDSIAEGIRAEYNFSIPGTYTIEAHFFYDTCEVVRSITQVIGGPDASILINNADSLYCIGETVDFDAVLNNSVTVTDWDWTITDAGFPSNKFSGQNPPAFTYSTVGTKPVSLIVRDDQGCTIALTKLITVFQPSVQFALSKNKFCSGESLNLSNVANNTISKRKLDYEWFVGTVSISTDSLPSYLINGYARDTTLRLVGSTASGCYSEQTKTFSYDPNPIVDFSTQTPNICPEFEVIFEQDFTLYDTTGTKWSWDFGNGITSGFIDGKSIYILNGKYTVGLTATTELGCTATEVKVDYINVSYPEAAFVTDKDTICINEDVTLSITKLIGVVEYEWDYGDGFTENGVISQTDYTHRYNSQVGMIYPSLVIRVDGCTDLLLTDSVFVYELKADYTLSEDSLCGSGPVTFTNTSVGASSFTWDFGFGPETTNPMTTTKNYGEGVYNTYIAVENILNGCVDTLKKTINVFPPFSGTVQPVDTLCPGDKTTLQASGGIDYLWSPIAGLSDPAIANPEADPINTTTYTVSITDINNCKGTKTLEVVRDKTALDLPLSDITNCGPYSLVINSGDNQSIGNNHLWNFGDGVTSQAKEPAHNFNTVGNYTVTYTVYDLAETCQQSTSFNINILIEPKLTMPLDTVICFNDNLQVLASLIPTTGAALNWTSSTIGESVSNVLNPIVSPKKDTKYILTATLPNTCSTKDSITVGVDNPKAVFSLSPTSSCVDSKIVINNTSTGTNFEWDFGDGATSILEDPVHVFTIAGVYNVVLDVYQRNKQCVKTATQSIIVNIKPDVRLASDTLLCFGQDLQLKANGGESFSWEPKAAFSTIAESYLANPIVKPTKDITYTVTVINEFVCTQVETINVKVVQGVYYTPPYDTTLVIGESVGYNINPSRTDIEYRIEPEMFGGCSDCYAPFYYRPTEDQCYTLYISDGFGCVDDTIPYCITIEERYTMDVPSAFTPNDDANNDKIFVRGYGIDYLIDFTIYNRWGEVVFKTDKLEEGWDGIYKKKEQGDETFVYSAQAKMLNGTTQAKNGYITIIK